MQGQSGTLGDQHPDTLVSRCALASLLLSQRRHDDALPHLRSTLQASSAVLGAAHPTSQQALKLYAKAQRACGHAAIAALLLDEAKREAKKSAHQRALAALEQRLSSLQGATVTLYSSSAAYKPPRPPSDPLAIPTHGISFHGVLRFVKDAGGISQLIGRSTADVVERFLLSATVQRRSSFCEHLLDSGCALAAGAVGPATIFISHSWSMHFDQLLAALQVLQERAERERRPAPFFFLDLFVNNQHSAGAKPFEWWKSVFRSNIRSIRHTAMVLEWDEKKNPLERVWCLWEAACSVLHDEEGGGGGSSADGGAAADVRFEVVQPPSAAAGFKLIKAESPGRLEDLLASIDVRRASAYHGADCRVCTAHPACTAAPATADSPHVFVCREVLLARIDTCPDDLASILGAVGDGSVRINEEVRRQLDLWLAARE